MTLVAIGFFLVQNAEPCYNTFLTRIRMSELHKQLTQHLLAVQALLEEDHAENASIQDAFNALCCAIDEEML